jgi:hypothetical protein
MVPLLLFPFLKESLQWQLQTKGYSERKKKIGEQKALVMYLSETKQL